MKLGYVNNMIVKKDLHSSEMFRKYEMNASTKTEFIIFYIRITNQQVMRELSNSHEATKVTFISNKLQNEEHIM